MKNKLSRRDFVRNTVVLPSLTMIGELPAAQVPPPDAKFTAINLDPHFNVAAPFPITSGSEGLWGIPFKLRSERQAGMILLGTTPVSIAIEQKATYVCVCHFCAPGRQPTGAQEQVGEKLAEYVLVYADGSEQRVPIRRRFEIQEPSGPWGQLPFAARPHRKDIPRKLENPLPSGLDWGDLQTEVGVEGPRGPTAWVCALANPHPDRAIRALRLESDGRGEVSVCGITLGHDTEYPLRHVRLSQFRITLPVSNSESAERWQVTVDLGIVGRTYLLPEFSGQEWVKATRPGLGEPSRPALLPAYLYAEVTASPAATLALEDRETKQKYEFPLRRAYLGERVDARAGQSRIELIHPHKTWVHVKLLDADGKPAPARVRFLTPEGRYLPPYGHRSEVNSGFFQDYGADLKLGGANYAYVDGTFQVELPVGEVYVEGTRGFDYEPLRQKLHVAEGQRELTLAMRRTANLRAQGWVTSDTHVHFLSPHTALLEARAEGLNLIHLLASQWGDLFTNVGDYTGQPVVSADGEAMVYVATENRQHLLGHLGLLGYRGDQPIQPFTTSGPNESYLGDPAWTSLAEWAEACRQRDGLAISVHFPNPSCEIPADIVLNKLDAVELRYDGGFDALSIRDWYKYLNCGYRLPAVGGTDKMSAGRAVGGLRTYANLGQEPFSVDAWTRAVRRGNTFSSTGALLFFRVEGKVPGQEIALGTGEATLGVEVEAQSFVPLHHLEVVLNGRVVARADDRAGARTLRLRESVKVSGPSWLAARCSSAPETRDRTGWPYLVAAHTSPVYCIVRGQTQFAPEAAAYFLALIDGGLVWLDTLATRPDPQRLARIRQVFLEASAKLHERSQAHRHA